MPPRAGDSDDIFTDEDTHNAVHASAAGMEVDGGTLSSDMNGPPFVPPAGGHGAAVESYVVAIGSQDHPLSPRKPISHTSIRDDKPKRKAKTSGSRSRASSNKLLYM